MPRGDTPALIAALGRPETYGADVDRVERVETHISWVFLTGAYAYKVKKPLKLPFLDFSTLERRRYFCEQELEINRRLAPELYLEIVPIAGPPERPRLGAQPAIEYAVKMREFPAQARLDRVLARDGVTAGALTAFAERLAALHAKAPPVEPTGDAAERAIAAALENFDELEPMAPDDAARRRLAALRRWTGRTGDALRAAFEERLAHGRHREGHGDLHLENLIALDGTVTAFDALEFDPELRQCDALSEVAFLAMDLLAHGRTDLSYAFLNRYLEVSGDYDGVQVLRFYLVYRALVRAKVRALRAAQTHGAGDAEPYLALAAALVAKRRPLLVLTHGLSGSGKTHVSTELVGRLPALRGRSDLERKRLAGLAERASSGAPIGSGLYDAASTARTYERLARIAEVSLGAQFNCVADATFLRAADRDRFRRVAADAGARFAILDCTASEAVLRERIVARQAGGRDASEADLAVLQRQLETREPLAAGERPHVVTVSTEDEIDYEALAATLRKPP